ncbi:MAG: class I SAM-dependent methyltransferase [Halobacteriaceae archaeon]
MRRRERCPVCSGEPTETLVDLAYTEPPLSEFIEGYYGGRVDVSHLEDGTYRIDYCADCDLYWKAYVLDDDGMAALYAEWIPDADSAYYRAAKYDWSAVSTRMEHFSRIVGRLDRHPSDLAVLDYGMGWGPFARVANAAGCAVYGYEVADRKVRVARENGIEATDSLEDLRSVDFDYVHLNQVLEHVPDPAAAVETVADLLGDDGICYLAVPNAAYYGPFDERLVTRRVNQFHPLEHVNGFTRSSLLELGARAGLQPVESTPLLFRSVPRGVLWSVLARTNLKRPLQRAVSVPAVRSVLQSLYARFRDEEVKYDFDASPTTDDLPAPSEEGGLLGAVDFLFSDATSVLFRPVA